ncbi:MAG: NADH-quinone oxidoreductase subunit NuoK [Bacteroidia bacterium]|nr:NADH-quinone oxidoreductase subunit NuoK [Bacteroidia bacterium]
MIPTSWYIIIGIFLFCLGVFAVITRRNTVIALIGIELMLNAANLNFVAFGRMQVNPFEGQMAALFVIVLAAAEVAVGLAIVLNVYKRYRTVNLDEIDTLSDE